MSDDDVAGLGLGMAYLPAIIAVSFYFEKRRSVATGIAVCGSGIGTFIFAPLTNALLPEYLWKGTVLIEAGILLNCILSGMVFRPLNIPHNPKRAETEAVAAEKRTDVVKSESKVGAESMAMELREKTQRRRVSEPPKSSVLRAVQHRRKFSELPKSMSRRISVIRRTSVTPGAGLMARKDVFYTRSLGNFLQYRIDRDEYVRGMTSLPELSEFPDDKSCLAKIGITEDMRQTMHEMMDFRLLLDIVFILFAVSNLFVSLGFVVPYIFLPSRGLHEFGFTSDQSSWLISVIGISNTVGRVVFGFIADLKFVNRLMLYSTVLVLCGICSLSSVWMSTFPLLMCYSVSFGFFIGR